MPTKTKHALGLHGDQLKIIALLAMTADHVGLALLPQFPILRILGRLAFPIYAYMLAEGCTYTRNRKKHFGMIFGLAALCQLAYYIAMGSLYMSVLVTFSLSMALIFCLDACKRNKASWLVGALAVAGVWFLCEVLPGLLPNTDFAIDYGIWGVMLPVLVWLAPTKWTKLAVATLCLVLLGLAYGGVQWFGLLTLLLLALYDGTRGTWKLKYLFYIYYPLHLVIIEGLSLL